MNSHRPLAIFDGMKRSILVYIGLAALSPSLFSQTLTVKPAQINFGYVSELVADSVELTVYNSAPTPCTIDLSLSRSVYSDNAFRLNPSSFSVMGLDSAKFWVIFEPQHNVAYDGQLIIAHNGPAGAAVIDVTAHGRFSNTYYNSTEGLSEEALKTALKTLLAQNFNSLSYNAARDNMYGTLDNVNGQVECVYTGRVATFSDRAGATNNNFNCEHTFPQGFFSQAQPMRGDIHHLFPTDGPTNSRRSNHPFGVVTNPTWTGGGSKYGNSTFEPRDAHKGAAARAMLYFVTRYQDYSNFFAPQEAILKQWHDQFPPNTFEIGRNQGIFQLQNNRNPYVDYPQFADRINSFVSTSAADPVFDLAIVNDTLWLPNSLTEGHVVTFRTAVVNRGNQPVYVGPQVQGTNDVSVVNATPQTLLPGESKVIDLQYNYDLDLSTGILPKLELSTNLPSGNVEIFLMTEAFDLSEGEELESDVQRPFPNPAIDRLELDDRVNYVRMSDASGRVVVESTENEVDVSDLSQGVYWISYTIEGTEYTEPVRIQRD